MPALTASKATAAGSPPSLPITCTLLRSPQRVSCSRAAARKVSPAASRTVLSIARRCRASFPIEVVLPAPLTPVIIMTSGVARSTSIGRSRGASRSASNSRRADFSAAASTMRSLPGAFAQLGQQPLRGCHAGIAGQQSALELFVEGFVDLDADKDGGQIAAGPGRPPRSRASQPGRALSSVGAAPAAGSGSPVAVAGLPVAVTELPAAAAGAAL